MKRLIQVLLAIQFVLVAVAIATGCLGCGPGSTEYVGNEAPSATDPDQVGVKVVDGVPYINGDPNCRVAFNRHGYPVCATQEEAVGTDSGDPFKGNIIDGKVCEGNTVEILYDSNGYPAVCADASTTCEGQALYNAEGQQVCQYEPPPPTTDPTVEHAEQCSALTPGDGQWFAETSDELMQVGCQPTDTGACAVTPSGEGSTFDGMTFVGTEFPLTQQDGIFTYEIDMTEDGRFVERSYYNTSGVDELDSEKFFRR